MVNGRCRIHGGKSTDRSIAHCLRTKQNLKNSKEIENLINTIGIFKLDGFEMKKVRISISLIFTSVHALAIDDH